MARHRPLSSCPVCAGALVTTRLGCPGCGTELVGEFETCSFCALDDAELDVVKVFLASRGNLRALESHLGVSYPTARARFNDLLAKLGLSGVADDESEPDVADADAPDEPEAQPTASGSSTRDQILAKVASGELAPDAAAALLAQL